MLITFIVKVSVLGYYPYFIYNRDESYQVNLDYVGSVSMGITFTKLI